MDYGCHPIQVNILTTITHLCQFIIIQSTHIAQQPLHFTKISVISCFMNLRHIYCLSYFVQNLFI
jgi:hypothetical protein